MNSRSSFLRAIAAMLAAPALGAAGSRTNDPFNVLVLGDSIAWGQGLTPDHRWRELLVQRLGTRLGRPIVEVPTEIHSGATIGIGDRNQIADTSKNPVALDRYSPGFANVLAPDATRERSTTFELSYLKEGAAAGEIPSQTPTVLRQLDDFDAGPNRDAKIDLIFLSAGINDVNVARLLDPVADRVYVREAIDAHCHYHLVALLDRIRARFVEPNPSCVVIVLSYYPMIGDDSLAIPPVRELVRALLGSPVETRAQRRDQALERGAAALTATTSDFSGAAYRYTVANPSKPEPEAPRRKLSFLARAIVGAANRFFDQSEIAIGAAVDDANRKPFAPNFIHVTPNIDPLHTVFTIQPDPQLWSVTTEGILPEDEVAADRIRICDRLGIERHDLDPSAINACRIASIGHPNPNGAHQYADAIWNALDSRLPKS